MIRRQFIKNSGLALSGYAFLIRSRRFETGISQMYAGLKSNQFLGKAKIETLLPDKNAFTEGPAVDRAGNVLFTARDDPVLSDFGIAKSIAAETQITATAMAIGSAKFMSPEQIRGESVDQRSDLYSFGVLLWQLLTGGFPYESHDPFALALKHANDPIPRLPEQLSRFQQLLDRLLAKRPEERFGSAEELAQALAAISLAGLLPTAKGEADLTVVLPNRERPPTPETGADSSVPTAQPVKLQNRPGSLFALGAVAVLVVVVGYVAYRPG